MRFTLSSAVVLCALFIGVTSLATPLVHAQAPAQTQVADKATLNLNAATAEQLATLPGIGVKVAERILEYRTKNGGFKKIEELMNVKGIGEKSFLKLKPLVSVAKPDKASGGGE